MKNKKLLIIFVVIIASLIFFLGGKKDTKEVIEENGVKGVEGNEDDEKEENKEEETKDNDSQSIEKGIKLNTNKIDSGFHEGIDKEKIKEVSEKSEKINEMNIHIYKKRELMGFEEVEIYLRLGLVIDNNPLLTMYKKEIGMDENYIGVVLNKENAYIRNYNADITIGSVENLSAEAKEAQRIADEIKKEQEETKEFIELFLYKTGQLKELSKKEDKNFEKKYIFEEINLEDEKQKTFLIREQKKPTEEYKKKIKEQSEAENKELIINLLENETLFKLIFTDDDRLIKTELIKNNRRNKNENIQLINSKNADIIEEREITITNFIPIWENDNYAEKDFLEAIK